ncbi:gp53-like domain-containing protein [Aeromonas caviae]
MANLSETPNYDSGIYQIETTDPVLGGPTGIANAQAKSLANRTAFLKRQIDQLNSGTLTPSWIASQSYVQGELQKLDSKQSVRAATTQNIILSGVQTIDGVALAVGDLVLVKDQTNANQNGIYLVAAAAWARSTDADSGTKLTSGARVAVEEGALNAGRVWYLATFGAISVGSTALQFKDEHPDATESVKGVMEIATQEEVNETVTANQKDDVVVTVKKLWGWVKQASESVLGMMKVATQTQTDAGTVDDVAVTPKKLLSGMIVQLSGVGYIRFPTWMKGFTIQWGTVLSSSSAPVRVTFPLAFSTTPRFLSMFMLGGTAGQPVIVGGMTSENATGFDANAYLVNQSRASVSSFWISFGFI